MLGLIFAAPFLLFIVVFALSNRTTVQLGLWPTDLLLDVPLSLAVLGAGGGFFVLGALVVGLGSLGQRRQARRAENRVRMLEREVAALRPRPVPGTPPAANAPAANAPAATATATNIRAISG